VKKTQNPPLGHAKIASNRRAWQLAGCAEVTRV